MHYRKLCLLGASAFVLAAAATPALAGDDPAVIEEVVVTAQKRAENVQDVPLSIIAVSEKAMAAKGIDDAVDLTRAVPNLRLDATAQQAGISLRIRGFGAASNFAIDPSVAPYIDGAFIPRPGAILKTFLDVESVEVLRGPQGTLFGRNATVGAISVRTNAPSTAGFAAKVGGQVAKYGAYQGEAMINVPVNDQLAIRFAGLANTTDGFVKNSDGQTYGQNSLAEGRLSAKWAPTDDLTWIGRLDYARTSGDGVAINQVDVATASPTQLARYTARLGGNPTTLSDPPSFKTNQRFTNLNLSDTQTGITSDLTWNPGGDYTVRLINAYRDWKNRQSDGDVVFTTADLLTRDGSFSSQSQSHELQFISPKGALLNGKLDFVAGLYYFDEDYRTGEFFNLGGQWCSFVIAAAAPGLVGPCNAAPKFHATQGQFSQGASSLAAYVQTTYAITPDLDLILGARETQDRKSGFFQQAITNPTAALLAVPETTRMTFKDTRPSWRANLTWRVRPDIMGFVNYSTGYKSGGFNSARSTVVLGQKRVFNSETSKDWEVGVKSMLLDRRMQLNFTLYRTDLDNFQDRSFDGSTFTVRNAGSVRAQGFELEGQARPDEHFALDWGVAYLDSKFTDNQNAPGLPGCTGAATSCPTVQDLTDRPNTFAPKWQVNLGGQYRTSPFLGGYTATLRGDMNYTSGMYTSNDLNPQSWVKGVTLWNARLGVASPDQSLNVDLFVDNLTDEHVFTTKFPQILDAVFGVRDPTTGSTLMRGFMNTPRTFGVRASKTF
ncbi:TonB-dependent receptor [Phenylobacterium sp. LjRoot219]|uniref:TonB-dependent receptor n=1 Tax=Phenylobacterium sp. LjRoot219 TaxID=3342283 RepID=UPI003ECD90F5